MLFHSIPLYAVAALFADTLALRPCHGFVAHCIPPMNLWMCIWWWVGISKCSAWWPKFTRCVSVEWCRGRGGIEGPCAVLSRLALPNCVPTVELMCVCAWTMMATKCCRCCWLVEPLGNTYIGAIVWTVNVLMMSMESPEWWWHSSSHCVQCRSKCSDVSSPSPQCEQVGESIWPVDAK